MAQVPVILFGRILPTKGAVNAFTKALALEEAYSNIQVNAITPSQFLYALYSDKSVNKNIFFLFIASTSSTIASNLKPFNVFIVGKKLIKI